MEGSLWIGLGSLAITLALSITAAAVVWEDDRERSNLTEVVKRLVAESRLGSDSMIEMRALVSTLREGVTNLQKLLSNGFNSRLSNCERRLDVVESTCRHNHPEV